MFFVAGCVSDASEVPTRAEAVGELATGDVEGDALDPFFESSLFGCSNQQIREAQAHCRSVACGSRGSNGIHWCDTDLIVIRFQCDCRTGADPTTSILD